jgi:predicted LPLAT superfamily acyltransferase
LRISLAETKNAAEIMLEGRVAGLWAAELGSFWMAMAPQLASKQISIDLRNVTYADADGKQVLRAIHAQTKARLVTGTPLTQYLAAEVAANSKVGTEKELQDANTK